MDPPDQGPGLIADAQAEVDLSHGALLQRRTELARKNEDIAATNELLHQQWNLMADSYVRAFANGQDPIRHVLPSAQLVDSEVALSFIPQEWAKRQRAREELVNKDPQITGGVKLFNTYMEMLEARNEAPILRRHADMSDTARYQLETQLDAQPMPDEVQQGLFDMLNYAQGKIQEIDPAMSVETDQTLGPIFQQMTALSQRQGVFTQADPTPTGGSALERFGTTVMQGLTQAGLGAAGDGVAQIMALALWGSDKGSVYDHLRAQSQPNEFWVDRFGKLQNNGGKISPEAGPAMMISLLKGQTIDEMRQHGLRYQENFDWSQAQAKEGLETYSTIFASSIGFLSAFMATGGGAMIGLATKGTMRGLLKVGGQKLTKTDPRLLAKGAANLLTHPNKKVQALNNILLRSGAAGIGTAGWNMMVLGRQEGYGHAALEGLKMGPVFAIAGSLGHRFGKALEKVGLRAKEGGKGFLSSVPAAARRGFEGMMEGFVITSADLIEMEGAMWEFLVDPTNTEKQATYAQNVIGNALAFGMFKSMSGVTPGEMTLLNRAFKTEKAKEAYVLLTQFQYAERKAVMDAKTAAERKLVARKMQVSEETVGKYGAALHEHRRIQQKGTPEEKVAADMAREAMEEQIWAERFSQGAEAQTRATQRMVAREEIQRAKTGEVGEGKRFETEEAKEQEVREWEELLEAYQEPAPGEPGAVQQRGPRKKPGLIQTEVTELMSRLLAGEQWEAIDISREAARDVGRQLYEAMRMLEGEPKTKATIEMLENLERVADAMPPKFRESAKRATERFAARVKPRRKAPVEQRKFKDIEEYRDWQQGENVLAMAGEEGLAFVRDVQKRVHEALTTNWPVSPLAPGEPARGGLNMIEANRLAIWMMQGRDSVARYWLEKNTDFHPDKIKAMMRTLADIASPGNLKMDYDFKSLDAEDIAAGMRDISEIRMQDPGEYVQEMTNRAYFLLQAAGVPLPRNFEPRHLGRLIWQETVGASTREQLRFLEDTFPEMPGDIMAHIVRAAREIVRPPATAGHPITFEGAKNIAERAAIMESRLREKLEDAIGKGEFIPPLPWTRANLEELLRLFMSGKSIDFAAKLINDPNLRQLVGSKGIVKTAEMIRRMVGETIQEFRFPEAEGGELPPGVVGLTVGEVGPKTPGKPASLDITAQLNMGFHQAARELLEKWGMIEQFDIHKRMSGPMKGDPMQLPIREGTGIRGVNMSKKVLGWFDRRQYLARLGYLRNDAAAVHEFSHAMEEAAIKEGLWDPNNVPAWMKSEFDIVAGTYPGYNRLSPRDQIAEAWAELFARYAMGDPRLQGEVPELHKWLENWLYRTPLVEAKGFTRQFNDVKELLHLWRYMGAQRRMETVIPPPPGTPKRPMEKATEPGLLESITTTGSKYFFDDIVELRKAQQKWLRYNNLDESDIPISLNPARMIDAVRMTSYRQMERMWKTGTFDISGNRTGESAEDILADVGEANMIDFTHYLVARRMVNMLDAGFKVARDRADILYQIERLQIKHPEFITYGDRMRLFANRILDYAVQAGTLTKEQRDNLIKSNPVYLPFQRVIEFAGQKVGPGRGFAERGTGITPMKGSEQPLQDPITKFKEGIQGVITKAQQNMVMKAMYMQHKTISGMGGFITEVPRDVEPRDILIERVGQEIERVARKKFGFAKKKEARALADALQKLLGGKPGDEATALTFWFQQAVPTGAKPVIAFRPMFDQAALDRIDAKNKQATRIDPKTKRPFRNLEEEIKAENGELLWFEVAPEAYNALMSVDNMPVLMENAPRFLRTLILGPVHAVRLGATVLNPDFVVRNLIRDPFAQAMFSKTGSNKGAFFESFAKLITGAIDNAKGVEGVQIMENLGLPGGTRAGTELAMSREMEKYAFTGSALRGLRAVAEFLGKPEKWLRTTEFLEMRDLMMKQGASEFDANMEAALAFKEVTVNFTRAGIWGRQLSQIYPYFNPRMQGLRKFYRSISGKEGKQARTQALLQGIGNLGGLSALAWWFGKDKDWYQDLPDWRRINYWTIDMDWGEGERLMSFAKPFEPGIIFGSSIELLMQSWYDYDPKLVEEFIGELVAQHLVGWPFIPAPVAPLLESRIWDADQSGYSNFFARDIVPDWQLKTRIPEDQYGAYTTELFKALGRAFNLSPSKLEYISSQYWGGLPRRVISSTEAIFGISNAAMNFNSIPGIGTLFSQTPHRFSKAEDTLHDIEFQLGRLSGSGYLTGRGETFRSQVNQARQRLREMRSLQRRGFYTTDEGNRRAYNIARRLAERWEDMKMSEVQRETRRPGYPR